MNGNPLVLDVCVLLNLAATGQERALLRALGMTLIIPARARAEALYLVGPPDTEGRDTRIPVDLAAIEADGLLQTQGLDQASLPEFIRCAALIADPDAECLAIAGARRLPLATDDRKLRRIYRELYGGKLLSTLELLRTGVETLRLPDREVRELARNLRQRGRFAPPRDDGEFPHSDWYRSLLSE